MTEHPEIKLLEKLDEEYDNVCFRLEEALRSFSYLKQEIEYAVDDIQEELDSIRNRLEVCSRVSVFTAANTLPSNNCSSLISAGG